MATQTQTPTRPEQDQTVEKKIQRVRELYAAGPEVGKTALETLLRELASRAPEAEPGWEAPAGSASVRAQSRS